VNPPVVAVVVAVVVVVAVFGDVPRDIGHADAPDRLESPVTSTTMTPTSLATAESSPSMSSSTSSAAGGADTATAALTAAAFTLSQEDAAVWLSSPDGTRRARLSPTVHVLRRGAREQVASAAQWNREGDAFVSQISVAGATVDLRIDHRGLQATSTTATKTPLASLAVEVFVPSSTASVLDRAYRFGVPPVRVDRWTPQVARFDRLTLLGRAQGFRVARVAGGFAVRLDLDDARSHPFVRESACTDDMWKTVGKIDASDAAPPMGTTRTVALRVFPDAPSLPLLLRWPRGRKAAMVFTDHADQSSAQRLGALMFGESTTRSPTGRQDEARGMLAHGLVMTKSVFALPHYYYPRQLDDERFVSVLDRVAAAGIEVAVHSVSGGPDPPSTTKMTLQRYARFAPQTWIDHQPTTNCEALTNRGALPGPWYTVDVLDEAGFRYAWAGIDRHDAQLNLFAPQRRDDVMPLLFQHPDTRDLWLFVSQWMGFSRRTFLKRYDEPSLDALVAERGVHIAHTYLDIHIVSGTPLDAWALLDRVPGGFRLSDEAERLFQRLGARQQSGDLWVTTLVALADRLRAIADVEVDVDVDDGGAGVLVLRAPRPVADLSLLWPDGRVDVFDLPAGELRLPWSDGRIALVRAR
jgi:hypothetical protein